MVCQVLTPGHSPGHRLYPHVPQCLRDKAGQEQFPAFCGRRNPERMSNPRTACELGAGLGWAAAGASLALVGADFRLLSTMPPDWSQEISIFISFIVSSS